MMPSPENWASQPNRATHAFLYSGGKMKDLGTAPGYDSSSGQSINDSGQIAGRSFANGSYDTPIFLYSAGKFTNIPNFYADNSSSEGTAGNNINASGQIAGYAFDAYSAQHAAVFSNNSVEFLNLGLFPGAPSQASGINDSGETTGWMYHRGQ